MKNVPVEFAEDIDQCSSEVITVNMPVHHEVVQFEWLSCKYSKIGSHGNGTGETEPDDAPGSIVVR